MSITNITDRERELAAELGRMTAERDHFQSLAKDNGSLIIKTACELADVKVERDAEIAKQRTVMQQALNAAEKFRAKCHDGRARSVETYDDMTQLVAALKEALK